MKRLVVIALVAGACAPGWKHAPHDRRFQAAAPPVAHPKPVSSIDTDWWDHVLHSVVIPLGRTVSPARYVGWLVGGRPALDVNAFGQVPDSPWFENRIGRASMTVAEIKRGANRSDGPAPGELAIISGKPEGVTPGFVVRDSAGVVWFVKLDPPAYPELTTGAETVASRLLYAAGYHVPEIHVVELDLARLVLTDDARTRDEYNRSVRFTAERLRDLLIQLNPGPRGRVRALMSRAVPGEPLGSFGYQGTRGDDPNDTLPHERRRSLRGLWVFQAWLNNHDTRRQNTLDTFIRTRGELGYVRHYLLDFGDALGATASREKYVSEGYEERVEWDEIGKRFLCMGLCYPYWLAVERSPYRSVGIFEGEVFAPHKWSPLYPNAAFIEATPHDTFWAASILARFDDASILAAITTGRYSEAGAVDWIYRVLRKRRDKLLAYAFRAMLALDDPRVVADYRVVLTDLEVAAELIDPRPYRWHVRWNRTGGRDHILDRGTVAAPDIDLRRAVTRAMTDHAEGFRRDPYLTLSIVRPGTASDGPRVDVHLRVVRDHLLVVGIDREVERW